MPAEVTVSYGGDGLLSVKAWACSALLWVPAHADDYRSGQHKAFLGRNASLTPQSPQPVPGDGTACPSQQLRVQA